MSIGVKMAAIARSFACILTMICSVVLTAPSFAQLPEFSGGKLPTLAPLVRRSHAKRRQHLRPRPG